MPATEQSTHDQGTYHLGGLGSAGFPACIRLGSVGFSLCQHERKILTGETQADAYATKREGK
jgi:hypothetical protein